jgi:hypothetical protein
MHTTNYPTAFIEVAEDCPAAQAEAPFPKKDEPTIAFLHFDLIHDHPYKYTSDDVIFTTFAVRNAIPAAEYAAEREKFFSKGQPCLRSSPLGKRFGWGIHSDENGRVAVYPLGSSEYERLRADPAVKHLRAMRSARK